MWHRGPARPKSGLRRPARNPFRCRTKACALHSFKFTACPALAGNLGITQLIGTSTFAQRRCPWLGSIRLSGWENERLAGMVASCAGTEVTVRHGPPSPVQPRQRLAGGPTRDPSPDPALSAIHWARPPATLDTHLVLLPASTNQIVRSMILRSSASEEFSI